MAETKTVAPIDEVRSSLAKMEGEFFKVLPSHVTADKFARTAITAIQNMPSLLECDRRSLYAACLDAATQGLLPDSQEGVIVPFKGKARFMPMIKGVCKKIRNSGEIGDLDAQVVYENDEYKAWIDEKGRHFRFEKAKGDRGNPVLTFAYAIGKDGSFYFEEVSEEEMSKIEAQARASDSPWKGPFKTEMKRKSALRRLAKYRLPSSTDLANLTQTEDDIYEPPTAQPGPSEPGKPNRLKDLIGGQDHTSTTGESAIEFPDPSVPI